MSLLPHETSKVPARVWIQSKEERGISLGLLHLYAAVHGYIRGLITPTPIRNRGKRGLDDGRLCTMMMEAEQCHTLSLCSSSCVEQGLCTVEFKRTAQGERARGRVPPSRATSPSPPALVWIPPIPPSDTTFFSFSLTWFWIPETTTILCPSLSLSLFSNDRRGKETRSKRGCRTKDDCREGERRTTNPNLLLDGEGKEPDRKGLDDDEIGEDQSKRIIMSIVFSRPKNNVVAGDQARRRVSSNPPLSLPLYSIVHLCTGRSKTTKPSKNNRFLPLLWSGYSDDYNWSTKEQKGRKFTEPDVVRLHPDATPKTPPIARDPFSSSQGLKV